jgi:UDP-N-acetylglucosamine transferase subunit ALG13
VNIFLTVGTQLPFDRLVKQVDWWAGVHPCKVFAQIGNSTVKPRNIEWRDFLDIEEANERIRSADLLITHAGMGTILTRLEAGKPLIVMPRIASLGEHRNDHQLATVRRLGHLPLITVIRDERHLDDALQEFEPEGAGDGIGAAASQILVAAIREFVRF